MISRNSERIVRESRENSENREKYREVMETGIEKQ